MALPAFGDLVKIRMGPREVYVPCHHALLRQILKEPQVYDKGGPFYERARELGGDGLVTAEWDIHQQQRPLVQPSFDHRHITHYTEIMADEVEALTSTWRTGDVIDVNHAMETLTLRITARSLFSASADHRSVAQVERWLPIMMAGIYRRMLIPEKLLALVPTKINRQYFHAFGEMRKVTEEFIDEARRQKVRAPGLLSSLLDARDKETGEPLGNKQIFDQAITLLVAGTETAARALGFTFYLLGQNPDAYARVQDESDEALAGRAPRFEDIARLAFTKQVLMESLRIYPPGWMFSRETTRPCELGGHEFPKGTMFMLSPYIVHHNPELFPDPEKFDPDRWRPGGMSDESRRSVVPFSAGARKCLGDQYALTETAVAVAMITARWRLDPVDDRPLRLVAGATLGPRRLSMRLSERTRTPAAATPNRPDAEASRS